MRKITLLAIVAILIALPGSSQFLQDRLTGQMLLETAGDPVKGSPYLLEDWCTGTVYMKSGAKASSFPLKFNTYTNQLVFQHEGQTYVVENNVKEFELKPAGNSLIFRRNFPDIDKNTAESYYQVLADGSRAVLLKRHYKQLNDVQQYNAAPIKEYTTIEVYYVYIPGGNIVRLKKDKSSLLEAAGEERARMENLINKLDVKPSRESDLIKLFQAYNEL
jgi:hypothetical protein